MRLWLCSQHHFVVSESIKLKIKIKTTWKESNNAVLLKMCSQDADATEAFLLSFHFKWLSEILWIVVLEGLRAWFNKNNFPSRSQLPSHQAEAQAKHLKCSIVVLLVLFGDQHLANNIQRRPSLSDSRANSASASYSSAETFSADFISLPLSAIDSKYQTQSGRSAVHNYPQHTPPLPLSWHGQIGEKTP